MPSENVLICDHCGHQFGTKRRRCNLQFHIKVLHFPRPPVNCKICGSIYANNPSLRTHMLAKHANGYHPKPRCDACGKRFPAKIHLFIHFSTVHMRMQLFHCDLCDAKFGQRVDLLRHATAVHNKERLICDHCELNKTDKKHLSEHISVIHQHQAPSVCSICGAKFSYFWDLHKHKTRKHTGKQMLQCDECRFETDLKSTLVTHCTAVHLDRRRYKCSYCMLTFAYHNVLKSHMSRKHKLIDPLFDCDVCGAKFWQRDQLASHMALEHDCPMIFECRACGAKFGLPSALDRHRANVHRKKLLEDPCQCDLCGRYIRQRENFHIHWRKMHTKTQGKVCA